MFASVSARRVCSSYEVYRAYVQLCQSFQEVYDYAVAKVAFGKAACLASCGLVGWLVRS